MDILKEKASVAILQFMKFCEFFTTMIGIIFIYMYMIYKQHVSQQKHYEKEPKFKNCTLTKVDKYKYWNTIEIFVVNPDYHAYFIE